jgi:hypothetical protein
MVGACLFVIDFVEETLMVLLELLPKPDQRVGELAALFDQSFNFMDFFSPLFAQRRRQIG